MRPDRHSHAIVLVLALLLSVATVNIGVMRGASAAVGQIALCIGNTIEIVPVDAQGEPTAAPHVCPECIVAFGQPPSRTGLALRCAYTPLRNSVMEAAKVPASDVPSGYRGRAPPVRSA